LASRSILTRRAEVLETADTRDGVEPPEALARHRPSVVEVNVEAMTLARRHLRRGQGDTDPRRALVADEAQQRTPPAAQVQHTPPGFDADLVGNVLVFAALSLRETQRKVTVVLRSAEIGELPQAQPNDAIGQRVGELEVLAISHGKPQAIRGRETPAKTK